jgi:hypothetical protein
VHTPHMISPAYTAPMHGAAMPAHMHQHGHHFCPSCCHPVAQCCCGSRSCRKEAKELLVTPAQKTEAGGKVGVASFAYVMHSFVRNQDAASTAGDATSDDTNKLVMTAAADDAAALALGTAFVGGGCCVHLSLEYMPVPAVGTGTCAVLVMLRDSEQTTLLWGKTFAAGSEYKVKECIMSTKPGATVHVIVLNAIARLRWCEVFSC